MKQETNILLSYERSDTTARRILERLLLGMAQKRGDDNNLSCRYALVLLEQGMSPADCRQWLEQRSSHTIKQSAEEALQLAQDLNVCKATDQFAKTSFPQKRSILKKLGITAVLTTVLGGAALGINRCANYRFNRVSQDLAQLEHDFPQSQTRSLQQQQAIDGVVNEMKHYDREMDMTTIATLASGGVDAFTIMAVLIVLATDQIMQTLARKEINNPENIEPQMEALMDKLEPLLQQESDRQKQAMRKI